MLLSLEENCSCIQGMNFRDDVMKQRERRLDGQICCSWKEIPGNSSESPGLSMTNTAEKE
jgi:hypothetical protein